MPRNSIVIRGDLGSRYTLNPPLSRALIPVEDSKQKQKEKVDTYCDMAKSSRRRCERGTHARGERKCSFKLVGEEVFLKRTLEFQTLKGVRKQEPQRAGEVSVLAL